MPATVVQAPQTAAVDVTVVVAAGTPVHLGLYTAAGPVPACQVPILRKNPAGTLERTGYCLTTGNDEQRNDINFNLVAAGEYVLRKPATDVAIGIFKD